MSGRKRYEIPKWAFGMSPKQVREFRKQERIDRRNKKRKQKRLAVIDQLGYKCPICTSLVLNPAQWDLSTGYPRCRPCLMSFSAWEKNGEGFGYPRKRIAELLGISEVYLKKIFSGERKSDAIRERYFEVIRELAANQKERIEEARQVYLSVFGK